MKLISYSFNHGDSIPEKYAFCVPSEKEKVVFGKNVSPHLKWIDFPKETKSFVVLCIDKDVPSKADDVNQEGKVIPISLKRVDFFHWILIDIPPSITELPEGADSDAVVTKGKREQKTSFGIRGINDYTNFFGNHAELGGDYYGYDGPCPPWNDELIHHYYFKVYALDVPSLNLSGRFFGNDVLNAMEGHVLDYSEIMGTYTLNPKFLKK
ncbi:MAG: YbhB/YbcL family Raf kinase inhibitor-like protein [Leptospiraceae bacterium]|nr:YbhB/YbcL family Raf kinase inhibitor-like protein [Leptospiraceae bacterium]MDW7975400.1 YbhB/YbcL family Raf kinase inhibitor-like protein [Leptospiraceae bacterium]